MTQSANEVNDVVAKFTIVASVVVPLNLIAGMWGMNVKVPGQDVEGLGWFAGISAIMVALSALMIWWFKKEGLV